MCGNQDPAQSKINKQIVVLLYKKKEKTTEDQGQGEVANCALVLVAKGWRRGQQSLRCLDGIIDSMDMKWSNQEIVKDREVWRAAVHGVTKSWTQQSV